MGQPAFIYHPGYCTRVSARLGALPAPSVAGGQCSETPVEAASEMTATRAYGVAEAQV